MKPMFNTSVSKQITKLGICYCENYTRQDAPYKISFIIVVCI